MDSGYRKLQQKKEEPMPRKNNYQNLIGTLLYVAATQARQTGRYQNRRCGIYDSSAWNVHKQWGQKLTDFFIGWL